MVLRCVAPQALGVAANKTQLSREGVGFLKDPFTLSFYNVSADTTLSHRPRPRAEVAGVHRGEPCALTQVTGRLAPCT